MVSIKWDPNAVHPTVILFFIVFAEIGGPHCKHNGITFVSLSFFLVDFEYIGPSRFMRPSFFGGPVGT